jgi:hypothetical protein
LYHWARECPYLENDNQIFPFLVVNVIEEDDKKKQEP